MRTEGGFAGRERPKAPLTRPRVGGQWPPRPCPDHHQRPSQGVAAGCGGFGIPIHVWRDPRTTQRERKRLLALLIEDVTLIKQRQITAAVRFRGGATTTLTLPRPLTPQQQRATHTDVRQQIDALLDEYTDAQVAHLLNERGLRTGAGDTFDSISVQWVRFATKLKSLKERLLEAGMLTSRQACARLGVGRTTLGRLRSQGRIRARICNDRGEWLYWPPEKPVPQPAVAQPDPMVASTARGAV